MEHKASKVNLKDVIIGGKGDIDLVAKVKVLEAKKREKYDIETCIKELECVIKQELIDSDWFDLMDVNWAKVKKLS